MELARRADWRREAGKHTWLVLSQLCKERRSERIPSCCNGRVGRSSRHATAWPEKNLRTGETDFAGTFGDITSLESDLLRLASAVYACDLAFKRGEREDIVREHSNSSVYFGAPVINHQAFKSIKDELELALWIVSDDNWTIKFKRADGAPEFAKNWPKMGGKTILFSGGVDSFAGAVELIEQNGPNAVHQQATSLRIG